MQYTTKLGSRSTRTLKTIAFILGVGLYAPANANPERLKLEGNLLRLVSFNAADSLKIDRNGETITATVTVEGTTASYDFSQSDVHQINFVGLQSASQIVNNTNIPVETTAYSSHYPAMYEMEAIHNLVQISDVTHTSVQSGNWSNPDTWVGGEVPITGARVHIAMGHVVNVDDIIAEELATIRVDGTLRFQADVDTQLSVDTIIGIGDHMTGHGSLIEMGTRANPIAPNVSARIIITDHNGGLDSTNKFSPDYDFHRIGQGLITHGRFVAHGAVKTGTATAAVDPMAGDTTLVLDEVPVGWKVGDHIVIAGTRPGNSVNTHEERTIASIDLSSGIVTLDTALTINHDTPEHNKVGLVLKVHIINTTRNVSIETAAGNWETTGVDEDSEFIYQRGRVDLFDLRGHVMFMHSNNVDAQYVGYYGLGRTNKSFDLSDTHYDTNGNVIGNTGLNTRARYSMHFHVGGTLGDPAIIHGSSVVSTPGWGFVNHSSFVHMTDNVAFDALGASFATEAGNEAGSFIGNTSIFSAPDTFKGGGNQDNAHFGGGGFGFWFTGAAVTIEDNVASGYRNGAFGSASKGVEQRQDGSIYNAGGGLLVPNRIVKGYSSDTLGSTQLSKVPFNSFNRNTAYNGARFAQSFSAHSWWHNNSLFGTHINDLLAWRVLFGIRVNYSSHFVFNNPVMINDVITTSLTQSTPATLIEGNFQHVRVLNPHVEGAHTGLFVTQGGAEGATSIRTIEGGYFNKVDFAIVDTRLDDAPPVIDLSAITFTGVGYTDPAVMVNFNDTPLADNSSNIPPVAVDDVFDVYPKGTELPVITNDTDVDGVIVAGMGTSLLVQNYTQGEHGRVTLANIGESLFYKPENGFIGQDTFSYTISDGFEGLSTATVTVNISPNPLLQNDDVVADINTLLVVDVLANDDSSYQALFLDAVGTAENGSTSINSDGKVVYQPDTGFEGIDTFTYTASNESGSSTATVNVTVIAGILMETWTGIGGNTIAHLTSSLSYPNSPNETTHLDLFEAPTNVGDHLGRRISGWLVPEQTGDYTFWIASDDNGELYLSSNQSQENTVLIANVPGWSSSRQWTKFAEQQSTPVYLVAGQHYYIKGLTKEATGGDNLAVAWAGPGIGASPAVIESRFMRKTDSPVNSVPPLAPTNLTATVQFNGSGKNKLKTVTLSWMDNSNNETEFVIERCEETGKGKSKTCLFFVLDTVSANTTSFEDVPITGVFKYRVKARNTNDDSGYTNEVKI